MCLKCVCWRRLNSLWSAGLSPKRTFKESLLSQCPDDRPQFRINTDMSPDLDLETLTNSVQRNQHKSPTPPISKPSPWASSLWLSSHRMLILTSLHTFSVCVFSLWALLNIKKVIASRCILMARKQNSVHQSIELYSACLIYSTLEQRIHTNHSALQKAYYQMTKKINF